jgi:DNA-binding beta-propeller fold protein YncE
MHSTRGIAMRTSTVCFAGLLAMGVSLLAPTGALAAKKRRLEGRSTTIALFRNDNRLVAVNRESNTLGVLLVRKQGADTGRLLAEIGVGDEPRCVALGPNDREAYVTRRSTAGRTASRATPTASSMPSCHRRRSAPA